MAFKPTFEQELAISKGGSIIVSAAAGSGKTAVLVERVARILTDRVSPVSADKLLIVTYTNAAAAELRYRIEKRLALEFDANPTDTYLQKQKLLLNNAKICTIDSFCLDFIRENFELVGLDPSFKIADKSVLTSIYNFALSFVFNNYFENKDEEFYNLLNAFGERRDDEGVRSCVSKIYEFSRHIPFPENWLNSIVASYEDHALGKRNDWFTDALKIAEADAVDAYLEFKESLSLLESSDAAYDAYSANFEYYLTFSEELIEVCKTQNWDSVYKFLKTLSPPSCKRLSADHKTEAVCTAKDLRDSGKAKISAVSALIYCSQSELKDECVMMYPFVKKVIELVKEYGKKVDELLQERSLVTFLSAEQTALSLLACVENGKIVRSGYADSFSDMFDAVLVDEYQDTNTLQDTLFYHLSDCGKKLFCVGDMKQCIYKFRGANPSNFLAKKEEALFYDKRTSDHDMLRVDLGCNFRSRSQICDYINSVFRKILYFDNSGFNYDDKEELSPKAEFAENNESKIESHFLDFASIGDGGEFESKRHAEAQLIANTINEIVGKPGFLKDNDGGLRKAEYKDITILLRGLGEKGDVYADVLKKNGIPVSLAASDGINSDEVNTLVSYLKIINNPSDDIALMTVLTSPIFGITVDDLAIIRAEHRKGSLYSAIVASRKKGNEKIGRFLELLAKLRRKSPLSTIASLISDIFEETGMLTLASVNDGGAIKRQNLLFVHNLAISFETDAKREIRSFLTYFDSLTDKDFSVESSSGNSVKIMTIHSSKGLQFPICILANCSNQFNFLDLRNQVIINEPHGFSFEMYDSDGKAVKNNTLRSLMKYEEKYELLAEELRVFYVALTRAEEKLITFTTYKDLNKEIASKMALLERSGAKDTVPYSVFRRSLCYADWMTESYILDGYAKIILSGEGNDFIKVHREVNIPKITITAEQKEAPDLSKVEFLKDAYAFQYRYKDILGLQSKSSVTDIVHKADEDMYCFVSRPSFMQEKGLSSAERGTAIHKVMQHIDFEKAAENLEEELDRLYEYMYISETEYDSLDKDMFSTFFSSEIFNRILGADMVKREMRFLTEFPATELDTTLDGKFADENIVVQGAVDLLFVENGEIVILDFKTDRNKSKDELVSAYSQQLEIYSKACSKLLKLPVKELCIYSFALGETIYF